MNENWQANSDKRVVLLPNKPKSVAACCIVNMIKSFRAPMTRDDAVMDLVIPHK